MNRQLVVGASAIAFSIALNVWALYKIETLQAEMPSAADEAMSAALGSDTDRIEALGEELQTLQARVDETEANADSAKSTAEDGARKLDAKFRDLCALNSICL